MQQTTILHHYCPSKRPNDQMATWAGLQLCRSVPRWNVVDVQCDDSYSWADALERLWDNEGDLVNVDQDIAIHPNHLLEFEECPHEACVFAYYINNALEPARDPVIAHRSPMGDSLHWADMGDEFCTHPAMGLMRIRKSVRLDIEATPRVPRVDFHDQEYYLAERIDREWHIHWPAVAHHHVYV